jgi:predicted methyltransferase MtxX (methanogen marker protein 4)
MLVPGDVVIFVEEIRGRLSFWRIDILVETRAHGSGKKAWSW